MSLVHSLSQLQTSLWLGIVLRFCSQLVRDWVWVTDIYMQVECCRRWIHPVCMKLQRVPPRYQCSKCTKLQ